MREEGLAQAAQSNLLQATRVMLVEAGEGVAAVSGAGKQRTSRRHGGLVLQRHYQGRTNEGIAGGLHGCELWREAPVDTLTGTILDYLIGVASEYLLATVRKGVCAKVCSSS